MRWQNVSRRERVVARGSARHATAFHHAMIFQLHIVVSAVAHDGGGTRSRNGGRGR